MPPPLPTDWLIDDRRTLVKPNGQRSEVSIRVGFPRQVADPAVWGAGDPQHNYESSCWVRVDELLTIPGPVIGSSTLSALMTALESLAEHLDDFAASGGKIIDDEGDETYAVELGLLLGRVTR